MVLILGSDCWTEMLYDSRVYEIWGDVHDDNDDDDDNDDYAF